MATLERALTEAPRPVVLVALSLACILVAHWAAAHPASHGRVLGTLLVAPSDTEAPGFPPGTAGFAPMSLQRLPFPSVVVASTDDTFIPLGRVTAARATCDPQGLPVRGETMSRRAGCGNSARPEPWRAGVGP